MREKPGVGRRGGKRELEGRRMVGKVRLGLVASSERTEGWWCRRATSFGVARLASVASARRGVGCSISYSRVSRLFTSVVGCCVSEKGPV